MHGTEPHTGTQGCKQQDILGALVLAQTVPAGVTEAQRCHLVASGRRRRDNSASSPEKLRGGAPKAQVRAGHGDEEETSRGAA